MALIVEDGTGKVDADSYISLSDFEAYCVRFNYDLTDYSTAEREAALRSAALYIDSAWRFRDIKGSADQALEFPRAVGAVDRDGLTIASVPLRLKNAQCELAIYAAASPGGDLLPASTTGIKSETVGPISTTYMDGIVSQPAYAKIENFLRPLVRLDAPVPVPRSAMPTDDPWMGNTLHDSLDGPIPGETPDTSIPAELDT